MTGNGYAVDRLTPARHVASELDRAAPAALSLADLATDYQHPNTSDLARIREHEHTDDPVAWLIGQAVADLTRNGKAGRVQIEGDGGTYRLADGLTFGDLRFGGKRLAALHDDHAALRAPFDPMTGRFAGNVRRNTGKDSMDGLRESMREFGWIPQLPAIRDERGVVIMGHRRLAVAAELRAEGHDIADVVSVVRFGDGDEADAKRFRLAVASNLDAKPFTPEERKDIAEYLYGEREWTMARIGQALNVSVGTVHKDLRGFSPAEKPPRPKGGRPRVKVDKPELNAEIRDLIETGQTAPRQELATRHGVGQNTVTRAVERELGRREAQATPVLDQMLQLMTKLADLATVAQIRQAADDRIAELGGERWRP